MKIHMNPRRQLGLSLLTGLVALMLCWSTLERKEKKLASQFQMTTVLVSKKYIPRGKPITEDLVEEKKIPILYLEPKAFSRWEGAGGIKGGGELRARIEILKGEQITKSKVVDLKNHLGLTWALPAEHSALTLRLSLEEAVAGFVRPGDWVSVYGVKDKSRLLIPKIQVVAVQDHTENIDSMGRGKEESHFDDNSPLVTLAVTPEEGALLTLAVQKGKITLTLLSALDETPPEPVVLSPSNLGI